MKPNQMLKVLLSYENTDLDLELGATYNINSTSQCFAGYYMGSCGGLSFHVAYSNKLLSIQKPSQVVLMKKMANQNYLFFVKLVPNNF
jgi:hypothetical protein